MHQIRLRLGLHRRPAGEITALPRSLSWILGALLIREGERRGRERRGNEGKEREGGGALLIKEGVGREGKGKRGKIKRTEGRMRKKGTPGPRVG